jgi:hypothetical protein
MELICSMCHAVIRGDAPATRCPACGAELIKRPVMPESESATGPMEVDHRGIVLPRRHAHGGIITPQ